MSGDSGQAGPKRPRSATAQRKMIDAATDLIAEGGLGHATMARIGEKAGYSRGLADYHFASKSDIVAQIIADIARRWVEQIQSPYPRRGLAALGHAVHVAMYGLEHRPQDARVLQVLAGEAPQLDRPVRQLIAAHDADYRRWIARWITEAQHDGTARHTVDADKTAIIVESMLRGVGYQHLLSPVDFTPTVLIPHLLEAISGMIADPAALLRADQDANSPAD